MPIWVAPLKGGGVAGYCWAKANGSGKCSMIHQPNFWHRTLFIRPRDVIDSLKTSIIPRLVKTRYDSIRSPIDSMYRTFNTSPERMVAMTLINSV